MSRLPFPESQPPRESQTDAKSSRKRRTTQQPAWTVTEASERIQRALVDSLPTRIRVVGEVSNFSDRTHWFFSLKDANASLRCVCFASAARKVGFPVKNGIEVIASGRVDYYAAQGSVQLYVDRLEPVGMGALELQLRQLMEELHKEGYFDPMRKMPLPAMPEKVAIVTSRTGAALQDVINTAHRRWPGCRLCLVDVHVQGAAAAPEIAAAIDALARHGRKRGIEAIILTRGGGSIEDLWAFNERVVADAIFRCPLPIVAAIGHETDTTIAELVADVRCATPTQAAMQLIPDRAALARQVDQLRSRLALMLRRKWSEEARWIDQLAPRLLAQARQRIGQQRRQLDAFARHPALGRPGDAVKREHQRVDQLTRRLLTAGDQAAKICRRHVDALDRHLAAVGPQRVLQRGYTYTLTPDGKLLRSANDANAGDRITTVLHDGKLASIVEGEGGDAPPPARAPKKKRRRASKARDDQEQGNLF